MKRLLASVLAIALLISCSPLSALQVQATEGEEPIPQEESIVAQSIAVTTLPAKTEYVQGTDTALDVTGGVITVTYSDETTETIDMTAEMVSGFSMDTVGELTLTVTYAALTTNFSVTVSEAPATEELAEEENLISEQGTSTIVAQGACGDTVTWALDDEGTFTIAGTGAMENFANNMYVPWQSNKAAIKAVVIQTGVTSIGNYAFDGCSGLIEIIIPNSMTSVGYCAFYNCTGLASITIPDGLMSIGGYAFYGCSSLTEVEIPNRVTEIGSRAFEGCTGLTSITIPDSVTSIGAYVFANCSNLKEIAIPETLVGAVSSTKSILYGCTSIESLAAPFSSYRLSGLFGDSSVPGSLKEVKVLGSSIIQFAFDGCSSVTSITIPATVTSIGRRAFAGCSSLTEIAIPDSVTSFGSDVFSGCSNLEAITLPFVGVSQKTDSDTYQYPFGVIFGFNSYAGAVATTQYYYGSDIAGNPTIVSNTFYIPAGLKHVTITGGEILYGAFSGCAGLTSITIPNNVTNIGSEAFSGCSGLTSITIPVSVTSIGASAFANCKNLKHVFYTGTENQRAGISDNGNLTNVTWHYEIQSILVNGQECIYCPVCDAYFTMDGTKIAPLSISVSTLPALVQPAFYFVKRSAKMWYSH